MKAINPRFIWAASVINPYNDSILEIGCGTGILAKLLSAGTKTKVVAIDKSPAMVAKAINNAPNSVTNGQLKIEQCEFKEYKGHQLFNKIVGFNVNFFLKDSSPELSNLKRFLAPGGKVYCFYQFPQAITKEAASPISEVLNNNGFTVLQTLFQELEPTPAICVIAQIKSL